MEFSPHQASGACDLCQAGASENLHCAWCGYTTDNFMEFVGHSAGPCGAKIADNLMRYFDPNKDRREAADAAKKRAARRRWNRRR